MKRLAILLLLLATTTQVFVAQTHVHAGLANPTAAHVLSVADAGDAGQKLPPGGDHGDCLLCQIAAHGAAALASHQSGALQPARLHVFAAHRYTPDPHSLPPAYAWSSRGPPRS